ncbi:hypothetical protein TUMSATVNIG1_16570 [Vibrio nigripulchritudo]|uniref:hypothetical protein n=1 Tax=Vibrio nigripulchritudo TaxID=28173 RepID=UPI00190E1F9B|nr:hypothetical protein [Vibrio nigripulchritudo]BCL69701.1 hypothetical protein VNTUMSATTG_16380 [Vibrio nigripulchritudo]BDU31048.1 hypothetical protein TUMSATVNIG1_16570 [Vibrio nigripulchritudo]
MITTLQLLNRLRVEKQIPSDNQVAKYLDISHTSVHKWRSGGTMSDELAAEVAQLLGLDVDLVVLAIIAERSKNQRAIEKLEKILEKFDAA